MMIYSYLPVLMIYTTFYNYLITLIEPIGQQMCIIIVTFYCEKFQIYTRENNTINSQLQYSSVLFHLIILLPLTPTLHTHTPDYFEANIYIT